MRLVADQPDGGVRTDTKREVRELERKNIELEETIELLKAAAAFMTLGRAELLRTAHHRKLSELLITFFRTPPLRGRQPVRGRVRRSQRRAHHLPPNGCRRLKIFS